MKMKISKLYILVAHFMACLPNHFNAVRKPEIGPCGI